MRRLGLYIVCLLALVSCGTDPGPQRPANREGATQRDSDLMAMLEVNQRMASEADREVISYVQADTVHRYAQCHLGAWVTHVTRQHGVAYSASAVGEVNVVAEMKRTGAVIGGEGNGGVIYPECHYGRDALVGIALFLSHLAHKDMKVSELRRTYPAYCISKNRIDLTPDTDVDAILARVKELYKNERVNDKDGVKIDFADGWVHLRKSNTEPIIRVYSEAATMDEANSLAQKVIDVVNS